jgi:hypothetical protein
MSTTDSSPVDPNTIATSWLSRLEAAHPLSAPPGPSREERSQAFADLFTPSAYLRDILVFTWDTRTIHTHSSIEAYAFSALGNSSSAIHGGVRDARLDDRDRLFEPHVLEADQPGAVEFGFRFETNVGEVRGMARLFADIALDGGDADWRAGSACFALDALQGHEERPLKVNDVSHKSEDPDGMDSSVLIGIL